MTTYIRAQMVRWESDHYPGFVECQFTDALGRTWNIVDKVPMFTLASVWSDSQLPQPAVIACAIVAKRQDKAGREIVEVSTAKVGMEASDGTTSFELFAEQLQDGLA